MEKTFYINARRKFCEKMERNTAAIFTAGELITSTNDECFGFEVDRNFYYLTGIDFPGVKLIIKKNDSSVKINLFVPFKDKTKEKWTGIIPDKLYFSNVSGIDVIDILYLDEFEEYIDELSCDSKLKGIYMLYQEMPQYVPDVSKNILYYEVCDKVQDIEISDAANILTDLRKVKEKSEIDLIVESAHVTDEALHSVIKSIKPGIMEYEIIALFNYVASKNNCKLAFETIVASGINATILHYTSAQNVVHDGDLLLIDCGAAKNRYNSDVTRTYPVNGKFSDIQKLYYEIVLNANKMVIERIKPGESLYSLNNIVKEYYKERLMDVGLINSEAEVSEYYYHSVSHSLGLDTHDVFNRDDLLVPGMVITVEPGLYIKDLSLGIRIEDDVLVTENGCKVLTDFIPKEIADIEALMA